MPEILAPVSNFTSLKSAINNGADAVYLGLNEFNARANLKNFSLEELEEVVKKAHLFNVKVYLTLNILFKDDEFDKVEEILDKTSTIGVDAFIIQDIGLYYFIKQKYPNLEIHASTQMGIQNFYGAKELKSLGYKRIVLARETPLCDIKEISDKLKIDIEYFVQGALCVSFSGNCYLCSLLAGTSGNRGKCKQFCRLNYTLTNDNKTSQGYLLSTRDFCMLPFLKDLAQSGVISFKIEGRARRESYVGESTKIYKNAVLNDYKYSNEDIISLKKLFNRGDFIPGYFDANKKIIYNKAQNHIGVEIGKVISVNYGKKFNEIKLLSSHKLNKEDVIKFFIDEKEVGIITVVDFKEFGKGEYVLTTTNKIPNGAKARLIVDSAFEKEILQREKKIEVDLSFSAQIGQKAMLIAKTENCQIKQESENIVQEAKTSPISKEDCFNQLSKLGENYSLKNIEINIENIFMAKSELNELRRKAIKKLTEEILKNYEKNEKLVKKAEKIGKNIDLSQKNIKNQTILAFDNFDLLSKKDFENDILIFKPNNFNKEEIKNIYEKYKNFNVYISLPVIATSKEAELLKDIANDCENWGVVSNNYYSLNFKSKDKTIIGENMNVFNSYAVKFYAEQGYDKIILSNEITAEQNIKNSGTQLFYYSSYYPEYMNFNHCPIKENIGGNCLKCNFKEGYKYKLNNTEFDLIRKRILKCQFVLKANKEKTRVLSDSFSEIVEKRS